ncbi:glucose PTS transporter subunit IIA [Enterobacteriaceae endosymbiont of Neohaemonia nigricornis]|uniref:glucose PTS transporter subunit IIA n=1 Tax=Enterobacteriaceae endosymbiont of Neohaemonia nigricornis TaxID=2675792 RepID=UPI001449B696|nr:glucose PTS transporter subunit IIA [Enterobacteriaceae endosymbiont of Neohaemonia nigricornis]QJC30587.1 PTS glucose transporter subunit IIA [Enterobacteriaceae endosymbiont of Neohaemonia nigricornis]
MLFNKIFKKNTEIKKHICTQIFTPITGTIIDLKYVPDPVFADKIVGDGIAIKPTGNIIVAPVDGIIGKIFDTNHAFSIITKNNIELFVHFGIDTINLQGKGFKRIFNFTTNNNTVIKGDNIIEVDLEYLKKHAKSILTPVIISNIEDIKQIVKVKKNKTNVIAGMDIILQAYK